MGPAVPAGGETYCNPAAGERLTGNFSSSLPGRFLAGLALAIVIALIARSRRTLSGSGAVAAVLVATACAAGGWSWAWLLIAFFLSGTGLSKLGEAGKRSRMSDVVEKGGERDARQVLANGGVLALAALFNLMWPSLVWQVLGAGAIAASTADTWATEIGTLSHNPPRSLVTWRRVETGTSGGVSGPGTAAAFAGAFFIGLAALLLGWPNRAACAAVIGGFGGSLLDSILGGTLQSRRWCTQCERGTERAYHVCGNVTTRSGGIRWLDNDIVNLVSSLGGAFLGLLCLI